jgi:hypothetical protein
MGMSKRSPSGFDHADTRIQLGYSDARGFLDGGGAERPPIRMRMDRYTATTRTPYGPVALG